MPWSYKTYRGLHSAQAPLSVPCNQTRQSVLSQAPEGLEDFLSRYNSRMLKFLRIVQVHVLWVCLWWEISCESLAHPSMLLQSLYRAQSLCCKTMPTQSASAAKKWTRVWRASSAHGHWTSSGPLAESQSRALEKRRTRLFPFVRTLQDKDMHSCYVAGPHLSGRTWPSSKGRRSLQSLH